MITGSEEDIHRHYKQPSGDGEEHDQVKRPRGSLDKDAFHVWRARNTDPRNHDNDELDYFENALA